MRKNSTISWMRSTPTRQMKRRPFRSNRYRERAISGLCGDVRNQHRVLCGDATSPGDVARLLGERKPLLMVTGPRRLEWLRGCRSELYEKTDRRAHQHFDLVGHESGLVGCVRPDSESRSGLRLHASKFTREVLDGYCESGFSIISRSSGTKAERC